MDLDKQESCVFLAERQELKCWPRPKTSHTAPLQHSFSSSVNIPILLLSIIIFCCPQNSASQIIGISHHHRKLAAWSEDFNPFEIKGGEVGLGQRKWSKSPSLKPFLTSSFWNIIEKQWWREGMPPPGAHVRQEFYCWTSMYGLILMMIDDMISDNDCRLIIRVKMLWPIDAYSERTLRH